MNARISLHLAASIGFALANTHMQNRRLDRRCGHRSQATKDSGRTVVEFVRAVPPEDQPKVKAVLRAAFNHERWFESLGQPTA